MNYADRVKETTTATSVATITLGGAVSPMRTFAAAFSVGTTDIPVTTADAAGNFESSTYTLTNSTTLTRTAIVDSSNAGAAVTFPAGSKEVFCTVHAKELAKLAIVKDVTFSAAIPLTQPGSTYMAASTVTGPLTFTAVAGAVRGALVYLRLTADGVNAPNFTAFKEWGGSSGYDNRNGIVNQLQFFYDGSDLFYSASQAVGAVAVDNTAPTLSSPSGTATGTTTATVTVTTNEANGTLYALVTTNATETAATIKASGATQAITSTGAKSFNITGLVASTAYFSHFVHRDAAGNDSAVANGTGFSTPAAGDTTAPTLSSATATKTGSTTATGNVTTANDANGTLYYMASVNATETAATVKAGASQAVTATGVQTVSFTGLPAGSTLYGHYLHRDAAGNDSAVANTAASFVTDAAPAASEFLRLTTLQAETESGTGPYTYSYTTTSGVYDTPGNGQGGVSTQVRPTGADCYATVVSTASTSDIIFGVTPGPGPKFATMAYGIFEGNGSNTFYTPITAGAVGTATTFGRQQNDRIRLRFSGTTLIAEVARAASPTVFTTVYTWTSVPSTSWKWAVNRAGTVNFTTAECSGLV